MKETEEDTNKLKDIPRSLTGEYYLKVRISQSYLQIQCNRYQNSNGIFENGILEKVFWKKWEK